MKAETLQRARTLESNIHALKRALNCFEDTYEGEKISLNPRIIIEYDANGREQEEIPISLNEDMVNHLKTFIRKGLKEAEQEFDAL